MKTLDKSKTKIFLIISIFLFIGILAVSLMNRSATNTQEPPSDELSSSYCQKYIEFDEQVAILEYSQQLEKIEELTRTSDFPNELQQQYETIIAGYKKALSGQDVSDNEEENLQAYEDIARHARDNCELYSRN